MNWQEVYNKLSDDLVNAFNFYYGNMKLTKVFKATIIEKINDTVYKVSYKNAEYKVKSYYDLIIGDIVWVCAPGGDWDSLFVQSYNGFLDRIITTDKVVNNLTTNVAGTVLDGRMGKSLKDQLEQQNSNLTTLGDNLNPPSSEKVDGAYAYVVLNPNAWTVITIPLNNKLSEISYIQVTPQVGGAYRIHAPIITAFTANSVEMSVYSLESVSVGMGFWILVYGK